MSQLEKIMYMASQQPSNVIPITRNFSYDIARNPHAIIAGGTGSGKSYFMNYLIWMLSAKKNMIYLCDPKRSDLASFDMYMPEERVAYSEKGIIAIFEEVRKIMEYRYEKMDKLRHENPEKYNNKDYRDFDLTGVVLIVDEMAAFVGNIQDRKIKTHVDNLQRQIVNKGRQAGVFFWSMMQQPNATNISTEVRNQMGLRVYLGSAKPEEYRMLLGDTADLPDRKLSRGVGFVLVNGSGEKVFIIHTPFLNSAEEFETNKATLACQFELHEDMPEDWEIPE